MGRLQREVARFREAVDEKQNALEDGRSPAAPPFADHLLAGAAPPGSQQREIAFGRIEGAPGGQNERIELEAGMLAPGLDQAEAGGAEHQIEPVDGRVGFLRRPLQPQFQRLREPAVDRLQAAHGEQMRGGHRQARIADQAQQGLEIPEDRSRRALLEVLGGEELTLGGSEVEGLGCFHRRPREVAGAIIEGKIMLPPSERGREAGGPRIKRFIIV